MGSENLNPGSANQLSYKALGRSFTNIVAKNSIICLLWFNEFMEFSDKSYTYELNRTDKQLTTYINTKFKSSKYESNISKTQNLKTKWKTKELFLWKYQIL